jgi:xanthine dehydrogenase iron-sulfur cluster and FAD-binding subunit A
MGQRKVNNGSPIGQTPRELIALNGAAFLVLPRAPDPGCNHF